MIMSKLSCSAHSIIKTETPIIKTEAPTIKTEALLMVSVFVLMVSRRRPRETTARGRAA
jgi:hypothetical protein